MLRLCNLPKTGHWMGTAATTPTEGFILCVRTNVRWTGQPTTVSSHGYADARRLVRRATRALRHPARASASRSPVTNTFRCPLPSRCHDPRRTASYCVACCPAGALGRRATDRDEQGHFALFFERNGSAPSKDRTCDLGFRKTNKTRGVVFPYDSRNVQFSSNSLRLLGAIAKSRFHAIA